MSQTHTLLSNEQWIYTRRPEQRVGPEHYTLCQQTMNTSLAANEVLLAVRYLSVDPYMRIQQSASTTWEAPHPLGVVQRAGAVAQVLDSNSPLFTKGDWVSAATGWQRYVKLHASELQKLDPDIAPVTTALHILGMPGRTAWFGLMDAGKPKPGDTVVVSAAAGAVGSIVVQLAKLAGCRVLGIVGTDAKAQWLRNSLHADETINYRDYPDASVLTDAIRQKITGVDIYFDNVGGWISDAVIPLINRRARIIICGQISQYSGGLDTPELGPRFLHHMLYQRASIQGILARDYLHRHDEMRDKVSGLLQTGKLTYQETMVEGFELLPQTLGAFADGINTGKLIVKI